MSGVRRVGVDETSCKKRHDYITAFVDLDAKRVLFATKGKAASAVKAFKQDLLVHGGKPSQILTFSCDMSKAFLFGVKEHFAKARVVLDKFHIVKLLSGAVDQTRRAETNSNTEKGTRFLWLYNPSKLSPKQASKLDDLMTKEAFTQTAEAYQLRLAFQRMFGLTGTRAKKYLAAWLDTALESGIQAIEKVAETIFQMTEHIPRLVHRTSLQRNPRRTQQRPAKHQKQS